MSGDFLSRPVLASTKAITTKIPSSANIFRSRMTTSEILPMERPSTPMSSEGAFRRHGGGRPLHRQYFGSGHSRSKDVGRRRYFRRDCFGGCENRPAQEITGHYRERFCLFERIPGTSFRSAGYYQTLHRKHYYWYESD